MTQPDEVTLDFERAFAGIAETRRQCEDYQDRHGQTAPCFASSAAGQGFEDQGRAIADMYERIHRQTDEQTQQLLRVMGTVEQSVHRFAVAEGFFTDCLRRLNQ